jgi:hypothetical protein
MLIVISLVFIAAWAFSPTGMCVNLLCFSTFHGSLFSHSPIVFILWAAMPGLTPCKWCDSIYSKILLLCIAHDQTGANFFNIPDNEIVPLLT